MDYILRIIDAFAAPRLMETIGTSCATSLVGALLTTRLDTREQAHLGADRRDGLPRKLLLEAGRRVDVNAAWLALLVGYTAR